MNMGSFSVFTLANNFTNFRELSSLILDLSSKSLHISFRLSMQLAFTPSITDKHKILSLPNLKLKIPLNSGFSLTGSFVFVSHFVLAEKNV